MKVESATLAVDSWNWSRGGNGKVRKSSTALRSVSSLPLPSSSPLTPNPSQSSPGTPLYPTLCLRCVPLKWSV